MSADPNLLDYCLSERQKEIVEAVVECGSNRLAAEKLGIAKRNVEACLQRVRRYAAHNGYAPGHFENGTAPGFNMGKVTVQRGADGQIERTWERQSPAEKAAALLADAIMNHQYKPAPIIPPPRSTDASLLSLYTITDFHVGMYAWAAETGDDWDTDIASRVLVSAITDMSRKAPNSEVGMLNIQGDWCHWDGLDAVTPTSRNVLDADTRFSRMISVSMDLIDWAIEKLLDKHDRVIVLVAEGNHDLFGSAWLRKHIKKLWARNERVTVDDTEFPYYAYLHGRTMLGFHHGHKKKNADLPALFSCEPRYREMWGQADICYIHTGHYHHSSKEMGGEYHGAIVERHPTLAARDAHAARGGYVSKRAAHVITYHIEEGEVERATVVPRTH